MKYTKRVSVGAFLKKGEDIKQDDIITIANEGKQVEGQYGMQDLFLVKTKEGKEGNVSFNTTSINCLIDAYGDDSLKWIGKPAKVWAILSNVQGKMTRVYYFTHPNADLNDQGEWIIKGTTPPPVGTTNEEELTPEDMPF